MDYDDIMRKANDVLVEAGFDSAVDMHGWGFVMDEKTGRSIVFGYSQMQDNPGDVYQMDLYLKDEDEWVVSCDIPLDRLAMMADIMINKTEYRSV